jgi:hypothetical protein
MLDRSHLGVLHMAGRPISIMSTTFMGRSTPDADRCRDAEVCGEEEVAIERLRQPTRNDAQYWIFERLAAA